MKVPKSLFKSERYPVSYVFVHNNAQIVAILYIDKNHTVRGVEYLGQIGIDKDQLTEIINQSKSQSLMPISQNLILAFEVSYTNAILKFYFKKGYEQIIDFSIIKEMINISSRLNRNNESFSEFFIKYSEFWIAGMELYDHYLFMAVDSRVDIDHLKIQMMSMFESLV